MKTIIALLLLAAPAFAAPRTYELPQETASLADGPGHDLAAANCSGCHSADYVSTQPKVANPRAFWTAEVTKMRAAYGAPLEDADMPAIVDYLVAAYGK
jgi:mono/diheme cytochrome c family protein